MVGRRRESWLTTSTGCSDNLSYLELLERKPKCRVTINVCKKELLKDTLNTKFKCPHEAGGFEKVFLSQVFLIQINVIFGVSLCHCSGPLKDFSVSTTVLTGSLKGDQWPPLSIILPLFPLDQSKSPVSCRGLKMPLNLAHLIFSRQTSETGILVLDFQLVFIRTFKRNGVNLHRLASWFVLFYYLL